MLETKDLARPKQRVTMNSLAVRTGQYDHGAQRRWNGRNAELLAFTMKSSTAFDGESRTNEADPSPE